MSILSGDFSRYTKERIVLTIGNFDGVHLGHKFLINDVIDESNNINCKSAAIVFAPHPIFYLKQVENFLIQDYSQRNIKIKECGLDFLFEINFDRDFSIMTAQNFISYINNVLNIKKMIIGRDFRFGYKREGDFFLLKEYSKKLDFEVICAEEKLKIQDEEISSSAIRKYILDGKIKRVNELLGEEYEIIGDVVYGAQRGRKVGFPTANIELKNHMIKPKFGVYCVNIKFNERLFNGIANIGIRPTFDCKDPILEVHIFDFDEDLYGKKLFVNFVDFIREEKKFNSIDDLKSQIRKDVEFVKKNYE